MSLKQDLKNLEQQKQQELRNLHATYLRTKRDVKRAASPSRFIRRNIGASLGVATVLGLLLAPRPAPKIKESPAPKEKGPGIPEDVADDAGEPGGSDALDLGAEQACGGAGAELHPA
jgi:hypothetical protein